MAKQKKLALDQTEGLVPPPPPNTPVIGDQDLAEFMQWKAMRGAQPKQQLAMASPLQANPMGVAPSQSGTPAATMAPPQPSIPQPTAQSAPTDPTAEAWIQQAGNDLPPVSGDEINASLATDPDVQNIERKKLQLGNLFLQHKLDEQKAQEDDRQNHPLKNRFTDLLHRMGMGAQRIEREAKMKMLQDEAAERQWGLDQASLINASKHLAKVSPEAIDKRIELWKTGVDIADKQAKIGQLIYNTRAEGAQKWNEAAMNAALAKKHAMETIQKPIEDTEINRHNRAEEANKSAEVGATNKKTQMEANKTLFEGYLKQNEDKTKREHDAVDERDKIRKENLDLTKQYTDSLLKSKEVIPGQLGASPKYPGFQAPQQPQPYAEPPAASQSFMVNPAQQAAQDNLQALSGHFNQGQQPQAQKQPTGEPHPSTVQVPPEIHNAIMSAVPNNHVMATAAESNYQRLLKEGVHPLEAYRQLQMALSRMKGAASGKSSSNNTSR